ncbi:MAG: ribosome maturation factor RimM [Clostridiales bacterium]|jgi:16S rRNA processing protein RimM|nr:ribosome maturation factor RimM [Clostridiales bacterium]
MSGLPEYFKLGAVIGAHGLSGALRVYPSTSDPARFKLLKTAVLRDSAGRLSVYGVKGAALNKGIVLLTLDGVSDIEAARALKNYDIVVPRAEALPLEADEYYAADLYGMRVVTEDGEFLGVLDEIIETGANDVYSAGGLLIPAIKQCVLRIDVAGRVMTVRLLEGLR